jgi:methionine synthase I (cobalamin-dependent)/5,10-methylenetetrahydrofolate reductase
MTRSHPFLAGLEAGPLLADGAMGTLLYERLGHRYVCFEELNVTEPQLVQSVHRSYLSAGATVIETNTFGCNRMVLSPRGLADSVERFARAGARLAREAQESLGVECFVAGSIGPLSRTLGVTAGDMHRAFQELVDGLLLGGVDLFILETFGDLSELSVALEICRRSAGLPIVASMTFAEDGHTLAGQSATEVVERLQVAGADVIGANCGFGPQPTEAVVEEMMQTATVPLAVMPNAGLPSRHDGRLVYTSGPDYFAEYAKRMANLGIRLIGGCCGTTPEHIRAMASALATMQPTPVADAATIFGSHAPADAETLAPTPTGPRRDDEPPELKPVLDGKQFLISVELRPPRGANPRKVVQAALMLRQAGVTAVDVTDSALGRVRMSPIAAGHLIQASGGPPVVVHQTTRDRNIMALQADLIAAHALGIRHILALTGDPPNAAGWAPATGVYDLDSIGLITLIKRLNDGQDASGTSIGSPTNFLVGCSLNATADDTSREIDRLHRKLDSGADFIMTQAVFDPGRFLDFMAKVGRIHIPVILEILPLQSYRNAIFVANELPGVEVPTNVLERMQSAGPGAGQEGELIATETFQVLSRYVQGVYIVPTFDRYDQAARLVTTFRDATAQEPPMKLSVSTL